MLYCCNIIETETEVKDYETASSKTIDWVPAQTANYQIFDIQRRLATHYCETFLVLK